MEKNVAYFQTYHIFLETITLTSVRSVVTSGSFSLRPKPYTKRNTPILRYIRVRAGELDILDRVVMSKRKNIIQLQSKSSILW
jgi:hypothetical protein